MLPKNYKDLVTTHEQTRAAFVGYALEKNRRATPYVEQAKVLYVLASEAKTPSDLLVIGDIRDSLLVASGLSDKSFKYFTEDDKDKAIKELIDKFLKPAGDKFVDELVYRFLLIKGDSLGGSMRNLIGELAQSKLTNTFVSTLEIMGIPYRCLCKGSKRWDSPQQGIPEARTIKAISWNYSGKNKVLAFNLNVPIVGNNIDLCLFNCDEENISLGKVVKDCVESAIMFGELKGGMDPAGADEHWKTGNTALNRIRDAFSKEGRTDIKTSFIGAAIEEKMAREIYSLLTGGNLSYAVNLNVNEQLVSFCNWTIKL